MKTKPKLADRPDICVGLLECNTPERYEALGRLIMEHLNRPGNRRMHWTGIRGKDGKEIGFSYQEVVIHGT